MVCHGSLRAGRAGGYPCGVGRSRLGIWGAVGLAAAGVTALLASGWLDRLELPVRDLLLRTQSNLPARRVSAVLIDEEALREVGPWPWERERLAALVDAITRSGARAVALDLLLVDPRPGDDTLARALHSAPAVLAAAADQQERAWLLPAESLRPSAVLAHASIDLDHDGVMRQVMSTKQLGGIALPALAVAARSVAEPNAAIPVARLLQPDFRVRPSAIESVSAAAALRAGPLPGLAGKVVFVGASAAGLGDRAVTPVTRVGRPDPGVLVHAAVTERLIAGGLLHDAPPLFGGLLAGVLAAAAVARRRLGGSGRLVATLALAAAPAALSLAALRLAGIVLPAVTLTAAVLVAVLVVEIRLGTLAWRQAGTVAAMLTTGGPVAGRTVVASPEERLRAIETLAAEVVRREGQEAESRRVVAHELKTPLTSLRGLSQLLRDFALSEDETRRVAELLAEESGRLQAMVDGLLDLEQVSARDFEREAERVDLGALAARRVEVLRHAVGGAIDCRADPGIEVRGRPELLERVVDNLIGNAAKFSPEEAPIEVRARADGGQAVLEVADRGPGIAPQERAQVFRRLVRGRHSEGTAGLGLGLALVAEVVSWHHGGVEVRDRPGGGSVFRVWLPPAR